jgi:hypothetical protein
MKQTKIGNRLIVLGWTAPATKKVAHREALRQLARCQRIIVIKNGEVVSSKG